jgi:peptidoglycan-associated lipoprotein
MQRHFKVVLITAALAGLVGCAHQAPVEKAPEPAPAPVAKATPAPPPAAPAPRSCKADDDCPANALCIRDVCVTITPDVELAECGNVRVHFDFNASLLRDQDKPQLARVARCLRADHKLHVTIEGNTDERGTEEYNMALGGKRASQVQTYIEALGASKAQLDSISYGFEKPLCKEHDEECWEKNRRAGIKPQVGH